MEGDQYQLIGIRGKNGPEVFLLESTQGIVWRFDADLNLFLRIEKVNVLDARTMNKPYVTDQIVHLHPFRRTDER